MAALASLPIGELIEKFVHEAALTDPKLATTFQERERHVRNVDAYTGEIDRRGELPTLMPFLESPDPWVAYCTAARLVRCEETERRALATLERIASAQIRVTSGFANRTLNMIRFNHPAGAFRAPTDREREFLRAVTRGYPAAELQVETCLVSEWDGSSFAVRAIEGPPLVRRGEQLGPLLGPLLRHGEGTGSSDSRFWVNDRGMLVYVAIDVAAPPTITDDPLSYFLEAARCTPERLTYRSSP